MWRTSHGDRVLLGDEAHVFAESVGYLRDMVSVAIDLDEPHSTGVAVFDLLQPTQQLVALHTVAVGLLEPDAPPPELSAILEGTVYAVYNELKSLVEIEIDTSAMDPTTVIREAVLAGRRWEFSTSEDWAPCEQWAADLPDADCQDLERWFEEIETLADQVLWDRDFELDGLIADHDPQQTAAIKHYLGISEDYFAIAAPDATSDEFVKIDHELVKLRIRHSGQ